MTNQRSLFPQGLSRLQAERLTECSDRASQRAPGDLLAGAVAHLGKARAAYAENRLVNVRLAGAIVDCFHAVHDRWSQLAPNHIHWFGGAMLYFSSLNDAEPDFSSPIGFEDDTEVLNACLRLAQLHELCLNVEDFDDA